MSATEGGRKLSNDLAKVNHLSRWLTGFFITGIGSFVSLMIPIFVAISHDEYPDIGPVAWMILIVINTVAGLGYLITLGRLASRLGQSVILWCGGVLIFPLVAVPASYLLMQLQIRRTRSRS